jgi:hypothetical protein
MSHSATKQNSIQSASSQARTSPQPIALSFDTDCGGYSRQARRTTSPPNTALASGPDAEGFALNGGSERCKSGEVIEAPAFRLDAEGSALHYGLERCMSVDIIEALTPRPHAEGDELERCKSGDVIGDPTFRLDAEGSALNDGLERCNSTGDVIEDPTCRSNAESKPQSVEGENTAERFEAEKASAPLGSRAEAGEESRWRNAGQANAVDATIPLAIGHIPKVGQKQLGHRIAEQCAAEEVLTSLGAGPRDRACTDCRPCGSKGLPGWYAESKGADHTPCSSMAAPGVRGGKTTGFLHSSPLSPAKTAAEFQTARVSTPPVRQNSGSAGSDPALLGGKENFGTMGQRRAPTPWKAPRPSNPSESTFLFTPLCCHLRCALIHHKKAA